MYKLKKTTMKKIMLSLCLVLGGLAVANAQTDTTSTSTQTQTTDTQVSTDQEDQDRQEIQVSELPEAVRTQLESQDYSGWTVSTAYRSTQTESSDETKSMEVYIVELKNGADIKSVRFDKDGNKLDDEGDDDQK
jgi:hypothetical protein